MAIQTFQPTTVTFTTNESKARVIKIYDDAGSAFRIRSATNCALYCYNDGVLEAFTPSATFQPSDYVYILIEPSADNWEVVCSSNSTN